MSNRTKIYVDKKDKYRSLLTETLPYEVPIIFSNDMLYKFCKNKDSFPRQVKKVASRAFIDRNEKYTIPYKYDILKSQDSYRELFLVHPRSQLKMAEFLHKYSDLICYFTTKSKYSIRAPKKLADSFYIENLNENRNKYRDNNIQVVDEELDYKHMSSFFSYSGVEKLYKFYNSRQFLSLEKKFKFQWTADISNCFASIYSHSISWAILDKDYIKDNVQEDEGFGPQFDSLVQQSNFNETNGIPIGPELCRVFSEIIFQKIDVRLNEELQACGLTHGVHYAIRRYVDDYFIFANDEKDAAKIFKFLHSCLKEFNLHINEKKVTKICRPFITNKSKLIKEVQIIIDVWFEQLFDKKSTPEGVVFIPSDKANPKIVASFIDKVKMSCAANSLGYDDVASYIQGCFYKRVTRLIDQNEQAWTAENMLQYEQQYQKSIMVLIEAMIFFYTTAPSVSSSYGLAKSLILCKRFVEKQFPSSYVHFRQELFDHVLSYLNNYVNASAGGALKKEIHLESLNLLIVLAEVGQTVLLPEKFLMKLYSKPTLNYFEMIVLIYYTKDYPQYAGFRTKIAEKIKREYIQTELRTTSSEYIHGAFDLLACPHISRDLREGIASTLHRRLELGVTTQEVNATVNAFQRTHFFVKWSGIDLLNILEKKKLQSPYD